MQTLVILGASQTALQVRAHARYRGLGIGSGELELDIEIKLLEALLAADLGSRRAREAREQVRAIIGYGGYVHARLIADAHAL
jgi:hypothetical protein